MATLKKIMAGLLIVTGALILGAWIPVAELLFTEVLREGGFLACWSFLAMLAALGLGLLIWGLRILRRRKDDI